MQHVSNHIASACNFRKYSNWGNKLTSYKDSSLMACLWFIYMPHVKSAYLEIRLHIREGFFTTQTLYPLRTMYVFNSNLIIYLTKLRKMALYSKI
jgi:hypothetical protein